MIGPTWRQIRVYGLVVGLLAALVDGGCGPHSAAFPTYMRPELLYLKDQPYTRLYVEVDVVEGVDVPQEWLDELEAFLSRYCRKPDGIALVRDKPIPASAVVDIPMDYVAILCTDGPSGGGDDQPAYLHVVFYDSNKWPRQKARPPHVYATCPTAIVCDVDRYFRTFKDRAAGAILRHEAGHVLGLCRSPEHGDGSHCRSPGCLMQQSPGVGTQIGLLFGVPWKDRLCDACERDLKASLTEATPENLSFAGPFLVRHEDDYDVVRLPGGDLLVVEPRDGTYRWQPMLAMVKDRIKEAVADGALAQPKSRQSKGMFTYHNVFYPTDAGPETDRYWSILSKAAQDPCPVIRRQVGILLKNQPNQNVPP